MEKGSGRTGVVYGREIRILQRSPFSRPVNRKQGLTRMALNGNRHLTRGCQID